MLHELHGRLQIQADLFCDFLLSEYCKRSKACYRLFSFLLSFRQNCLNEEPNQVPCEMRNYDYC